MDTEAEKVYVAIGNDLQDGFKTLEWTLKKWESHPISIVILHVAYNISNDFAFVYTPFGKMPASAVSEEKLEVLRKYEQEKIDKLLSKYITFCGKVKAEILKVEKLDDPIYKLILDLISGLQITKLVMGFTFMKSSSWKSKSTISGSFYVHQHKPEFCEFFIICGGKQVFLTGQSEEGTVEDDQGILVAKLKDKASFKGWLGKIFSDPTNSSERSYSLSPTTSMYLNSPNSQNQWEFHVEGIESYLQQLLASDLDGEDCPPENESFQTSPIEPDMPDHMDSNTRIAENFESLRSKIKEAQETIQLKRTEAKVELERQAKAEWAISLCIHRADKLEAQIKEVVGNRIELKKELEAEKEQLDEVKIDIEESKSRLNSLVELQSELSNKLQSSTLAKSHSKLQLENAVMTRGDMVREIEELRRQRDVLNRRIEFCREKDAINTVSKLNGLSCGYREYTAEELRLASDDFSERLRLKSGGDWTNVYRGRMKHGTVAIKILNSASELSEEDFQAKVNLLGNIRHPYLVAMMGFCSELKCVVFEYMHNGNLRDTLFNSHRSSRKRNRALLWQDRIRVAAQVGSGLAFLHMTQPRPMVHGCLTPSNILLDRNHVAKIGGFGLKQGPECDESDVRLDIRAFGIVMLHLLTGRNLAGLVEEAMAMDMDREALVQILDEKAGEWPLDLAEEFAGLTMRCLSINHEPNTDLTIARVEKELDKMRNKADDLMARGGCRVVINGGADRDDSSNVPKVFLCPIFQDIMKNPHVAADGFSYELDAIKEWLGTGHDTSPMTNLRLNHTELTPNHTLRSLIQDWQNKTSSSTSLIQ